MVISMGGHQEADHITYGIDGVKSAQPFRALGGASALRETS